MSDEKQLVTITLASGCGTDYDDWPTNVNEMIGWLQSIRDKAPLEFRDDVTFEIDHERDHYDGGYCYGSWSIFYVRNETDAEQAERIANALAYKAREDARVEANEKAILEALKKKYPDANP